MEWINPRTAAAPASDAPADPAAVGVEVGSAQTPVNVTQPVGSHWILDGTGRDSHFDWEAESPEGRPSRAYSEDDDHTLETAKADAEAATLADRAAGVESLRPPGYMPLGSKVPFRCPRTPADLTPTWLTTALRYRGILAADVSVTASSSKELSGGVMGVIALVSLEYSGAAPGAPRSLVAKFSPQSKAPLPRFVVRAIFKAESHFYNDYTVEAGGMVRPACYLCLYDKARRKPTFCLLLEDCMPAEGFTRELGCSVLETHLAAAAGMARLHARWWGHAKAPPLEWVLHPSKDFGGLVLNGFVRTTKLGMQALKAVYAEEYAPILAWVPALRRRHKWLLQELFRPPLTLTHGDAHIENVFFHSRFDGGASFIDFGNMMFSQAMYDVAFYMVNSLEVADRRALEKPILEHYHSCLIAGGVSDYTFERAWYDYRINLWRPLISVCAIAPSIAEAHKHSSGLFAASPTKADAQMRRMYDKLNERIVAALLDHKWLELILEGSQYCGLCSCVSFCY